MNGWGDRCSGNLEKQVCITDPLPGQVTHCQNSRFFIHQTEGLEYKSGVTFLASCQAVYAFITSTHFINCGLGLKAYDGNTIWGLLVKKKKSISNRHCNYSCYTYMVCMGVWVCVHVFREVIVYINLLRSNPFFPPVLLLFAWARRQTHFYYWQRAVCIQLTLFL